MKKLAALLLAGAMVLGLAACGGKPAEENKGPQIESAKALLETVWASYNDDEKFPVFGGDFNEENQSMEGPGNYGLEDAGLLDNNFAIPADSIAMIDDAASLMHAMNGNTFAAFAAHLTKADDAKAYADALKANIDVRMWMCGFPEKLIIVSVGDYVLSAWGNGEIMDTFTTKLQAAYETAEFLYQEDMNF